MSRYDTWQGHSLSGSDEVGVSEEELAVMATAVETLVSLTEVDMQKSHQVGTHLPRPRVPPG